MGAFPYRPGIWNLEYLCSPSVLTITGNTWTRVGKWVSEGPPRVSPDPPENHAFISRRAVVQRIIALLFLLVFCLAGAMLAEVQPPKPDAELKKLNADSGHWTYEGEAKPGPLAPGGKFSGEFDGQMILEASSSRAGERIRDLRGRDGISKLTGTTRRTRILPVIYTMTTEADSPGR